MTKTIGYKQHKEHFNTSPRIGDEISGLSGISTCRYDPNGVKTADINAFMQRPLKYTYNVVVKNPETSNFFMHSCYFDNKADAELSHKKLKVKYYDQLTKPFLSKLKHNIHLSIRDQAKLEGIFKMFENLSSKP